jgi:hypothetical protein
VHRQARTLAAQAEGPLDQHLTLGEAAQPGLLQLGAAEGRGAVAGGASRGATPASHGFVRALLPAGPLAI